MTGMTRMGLRGARLIGPALLALLAGCSSPPLATYDISAAPAPRAALLSGIVVVTEPVAVGFLDADRIAIRARGNAIAYMPGVQWPERLPKLMQARLIQSFENARRGNVVGRPGERLTPAYQVNSEIRTFEAQEEAREVVVEITAKIVDDRSGRIVAASLFAARRPLDEIAGPAVAQALDRAAQDVMADIVRWAAGRV